MSRRKNGGFGLVVVLVILFLVFRGKIAGAINDFKQDVKQSTIYQDGLQSGNVEDTLKNVNKDLKKKYDGAKIQIIVLKTLGGYDIKDYTKEHFKSEGLNGISEGNGLLLVVAIEDKKYATYYGAALADEMSGELAVSLKNNLKPALDVQSDTTNLTDFNRAMEATLKDMAKILGNYCAKLNSNK